MLVLTRKTGQRIFVGKDVTITVGRVFEDGRVRLCVDAPRDVKIVREELLVSTKERNSHVRDRSS